MRLIIKKIYIIAIVLLNMVFKPFNINSKHIVIMMTFKQDILPIIEALCSEGYHVTCLLYTSPSPRDVEESRMPSSA